ncbi:MAG: hypothetical protein Q9227_002418 [Pyrenula ochraceoflavens]
MAEYLGYSAAYRGFNSNPTIHREKPSHPPTTSPFLSGRSNSSHARHQSSAGVRHAALTDTSSSAMSTSTTANSSNSNASSDTNQSPLIKRNGRLFLRDSHYPLPCDFPELNRQCLRSLMLMRVFGAPFCAPYFEDGAPRRVCEVACGSGLWSTACNDYFDHSERPSFIGLDIVPLAPDLQKQGLNWQFVQHDLRKTWPFPDNYFDFVFIKDASFARSAPDMQSFPLIEPLRILRSGGVMEIWDSDYIIRTLLPNPVAARGTSEDEREQAVNTATYMVSAATPWTKAQNQYIRDYNSWMQKALDKRNLTGTPCAFLSMVMNLVSDSFSDMGGRRIAIPFSEVRWEKGPNNSNPKALNADQLALRRTAMTTFIQMIESLEPVLLESSGLGQDEWDRWWAAMTSDLISNKGTTNGEALEVGAWWAKKK